MNSKLFVSRNKKNVTQMATNDEIVCDSIALKNFITEWTQRHGWKFENFTDFIKLTGIKTPIKVSDYNKSDNSFKCLTGLNKEIEVTLFFKWVASEAEIWISENNERKDYLINTNLQNGLSVFLKGRTVERNGKELCSYYTKSLCYRTLQLDDSHKLVIRFSEPNTSEEKSETFVLRNREKIEDYLLVLNNSLVVSEVYNSIIKFLNLSQEDIKNSDEIMISYVEILGQGQEQVRSKILLNNGIMKEYAIFENGETFHVYRNGSWSFLSNNNISISYVKEENLCTFSIKSTEENIIDFEQKELMSRIKAKITELQNFVK